MKSEKESQLEDLDLNGDGDWIKAAKNLVESDEFKTSCSRVTYHSRQVSHYGGYEDDDFGSRERHWKGRWNRWRS